MTGDIKNHVSTCEACREYEHSQTKETIMSHKTPNHPWQRIAVDLFEYDGKTYMVTSDYFSDFFKLDNLRSTTSVFVIKKPKAHFTRHGIPEQLISDNGPQFVSHDFLKFSQEWDFEHLMSSPHHSQANGKAENTVKEAKKILKKCRKAQSDTFLALLDHRNTPSTGIQISPAQRLFNRRTRSLLPMSAGLLKPSVTDLTRTKLRERQQQQARYYNRGACDLDPLEAGDPVRIKPWQIGKSEWQKGFVKKHLDERSDEVQLPQGVLRRNRVHLRKTSEPLTQANDDPEDYSEPRVQPKAPATETREQS